MGHFEGLLVEAIVEGALYKIYYFSPSIQVCVEGEGKGVMTLNAAVSNHETFSLSGTVLKFNGNELAFDSTKTQCPKASHLTADVFSRDVAELIIDDFLANSISSSLTSYTELPLESCRTLSSPGVCG